MGGLLWMGPDVITFVITTLFCGWRLEAIKLAISDRVKPEHAFPHTIPTVVGTLSKLMSGDLDTKRINCSEVTLD